MLVDFYIIAVDGKDALLAHACELLVQGRYYVHTDNKNCAEQIDELLWTQQPASFVPHQLVGEHATSQAPIVIGWQEQLANVSLPTLLNLAATVPKFAERFRNIIDLTSQDEASLEQGRARYRSYKSLGWTINYHDCRKSESEYAND